MLSKDICNYLEYYKDLKRTEAFCLERTTEQNVISEVLLKSIGILVVVIILLNLRFFFLQIYTKITNIIFIYIYMISVFKEYKKYVIFNNQICIGSKIKVK